MRRGWFDVRPPSGGLAFYVGLMIVISTMLIIFGITGKFDDPVLEWIATGMFVVGVGLWLKHSWARWVAFTFFSLVALLWIVHLSNHGISARGVIRLLIVLSTLYALWEWDVWPPETAGYAPKDDYNHDEEGASEEDIDEQDVDGEYSEDETGEIDTDPNNRPSFWSTRS